MLPSLLVGVGVVCCRQCCWRNPLPSRCKIKTGWHRGMDMCTRKKLWCSFGTPATTPSMHMATLIASERWIRSGRAVRAVSFVAAPLCTHQTHDPH